VQLKQASAHFSVCTDDMPAVKISAGHFLAESLSFFES